MQNAEFGEYRMKLDIKSKLPEELEEYFKSIGEPAYRAGQVFHWLHAGAKSFREMTNLSLKLRAGLDEEFFITAPVLLEKQISKSDGTIKFLWQLSDGNTVESVLMEYEFGLTVCISTQVGCRMGCVFCASALGGLVRNLTASEMLDQVLFSQIEAGSRISNIVLMGIGEPLDNYDNVMSFLRLVNAPNGLNIGMRHITLSTCGIIENIDKLAESEIQLSLAISLHAPDDETRSLLMPINKKTGTDELISACNRYFKSTGRRISYEYALINEVNDTRHHAQMLAKIIKPGGGHLNLILLNNVPEYLFEPSAADRVDAFTDILKKQRINFTIRRKLGGDIDASCGQLRRRLAFARD